MRDATNEFMSAMTKLSNKTRGASQEKTEVNNVGELTLLKQAEELYGKLIDLQGEAAVGERLFYQWDFQEYLTQFYFDYEGMVENVTLSLDEDNDIFNKIINSLKEQVEEYGL